mgnify:CR=1 FL=1
MDLALVRVSIDLAKVSAAAEGGGGKWTIFETKTVGLVTHKY